ncbi:MAG: L-threonylcarbamoyladenylate synthase [Chitinophagales bacterium]
MDKDNPESEIIETAAELIIRGELVAFPTETVYGLGGNGLDEHIVAKIFKVKGRRPDNPLILHVYSREQALSLVQGLDQEAELLMDTFWPGPLTLVAPSREKVPEIVRAGRRLASVRMPDHPVALALIKRAGVPIAAPSANLSGRPSPTNAWHVREDFEGQISAILDGGPTGWGIESTVLDISYKPYKVLRPGAVSIEQLNALLSTPVQLGEGVATALHYQPKARVLAIEKGTKIQELTAQMLSNGNKVGIVIMPEENIPQGLNMIVKIYGGAEEYGKRLYDIFRTADQENIDVILMELPEEVGLGAAVADRIRKAAQKA